MGLVKGVKGVKGILYRGVEKQRERGGGKFYRKS
jgi:hypothetical protein